MNIQCIKGISQINSFNALANDLYDRNPRKNQIGCINQSTNQFEIHGFLMVANSIDAPQERGSWNNCSTKLDASIARGRFG